MLFPVEPDGAEVLARDAHGRPALCATPSATIVATYPFEYMAAITPNANPEPTWRLYRAPAAEAGVHPPVRFDTPLVNAATMRHARALLNKSPTF